MAGRPVSERQKPRWDMTLRNRIEDRFRDWAYVSARQRGPIIVVMLALAVALGSQLPKLEVDTSTESFLRHNDPARVVYDAFREQFGSDQLIVIALRPPRVFDPAFLDVLAQLHTALEEDVPHVEDVTSLVNVRETRGDGDDLIVRDLLEGLPLAAAEIRQRGARARTNPLYRNFVLSADGRTTTLVVELQALAADLDVEDSLGGFDEGGATTPRPLSGTEESSAVNSILAIVEQFRRDGLEIHVAGGPVTTTRLATQMGEDMALFLALSLLAVGVFLYALFRRASAVFLPLGVVSLAVVSTFGAMALLGTPLGIPTQILPSFLLAVGVGGTVHLLTIFFRSFDAGASREDALAQALHHSGLAIVMTALTTAGGLVSFVVAEIQPVADLGLFAPLGIGLGVSYSMVLLPAVLHSVPLKRRPTRGDGRPDRIERALQWVGDRCVRRPKTVLACMSLVLVLALAGVTRLDFSYDPVRWFPPEDPIRTATEFMNRELGGAISLEVLLDSGRENGLHEPAFLRRLDALRAKAEQLEGSGGVRVGKSVSLVDVSQEIHQALNENRVEYRVIPDDRQLVAQELLLFENSGSDDLEDVTDPLFRHARLTLKLPYAAPAHYQPFIRSVEELAIETLGPGTEVDRHRIRKADDELSRRHRREPAQELLDRADDHHPADVPAVGNAADRRGGDGA